MECFLVFQLYLNPLTYYTHIIQFAILFVVAAVAVAVAVVSSSIYEVTSKINVVH